MNGHALRELAKAWATVAHDGVSRKGAGEPYINHCERVAEAVWGWRAKALAWLHDTVEDAPNGHEQMFNAILLMFGREFARDLLLLSRLRNDDRLGRMYHEVSPGADPPGELGSKEIYQEWIGRIAASGRQDVIQVKLADLDDNLKDIKDIPGAQSQEAKYLRARATLLEVVES